MRSPQAKIAVGTIVFGVLTIALLIYAMLQQAKVTCDVCVTFHGKTECRTAAGPDREQTVRTAVDNACGLLTSGMTNSINCSNTPPDSVSCSE